MSILVKVVITKLTLKKIYLMYTNQYQTSKRYAKPQKDVQSIYQVYRSCHNFFSVSRNAARK